MVRMGKMTVPFSERHLLFDKKRTKNGIDLYFTRKLSLLTEHNYMECSKAMKFGSRVR